VNRLNFAGHVNSPAPLARPGPGNGGTSSDAPSSLRYTLAEWTEVFRMMRDTSYQRTRLGPDVVHYIAWKRLSRAAERTLDDYERALALVCLAVNCKAKNVTHADLMLVLEHVPPGSWRKVRSAWSDFFKWTIMEGIRPDNPVERLPKLRPTPDPVYDLWRQDELDLLVAGTRTMEQPLTERLRVMTMIESGGRKAELIGLQLGHFDLFNKTVTLTGKGNKTRLVPISEALSRTVDEYLLTGYLPPLGRLPALDDFLWYGVWRRGQQILALKPERCLSSRGFHEWWRRAVAAAGVRYRKPHMTRHTFATDVLDATEGDLYAVQQLLGHTTTRPTETYLHSSRTRTQAAIKKLEEYRRR
jgi:integrase/recombinase XerC